MNRWEALTIVVRAFVERDRPGYAFGAVVLFVIPVVIAAGAVVLRLTH